MREILFRGKRIDNGKWVYGAFCQHDWADDDESRGVTEKPSIIDYNNELRWTYVIPSSVGQFTGLTDKNGTKIFEGDIVLTQSGELCVVKYGRHDLWCCGCCFKSHESVGFYLEESDDSPHSDDEAWHNIEVIGNIHDNPELLKGGASDA